MCFFAFFGAKIWPAAAGTGELARDLRDQTPCSSPASSSHVPQFFASIAAKIRAQGTRPQLKKTAHAPRTILPLRPVLVQSRSFATRRLNPQVCDTGRASALRSVCTRTGTSLLQAARTGHCRCTRTLAWDLVAARLGLRRACIMMCQWRPCSGGRAGVRSHHWVGILVHAD